MNAKDILKFGHLTVLQTLDGLPATAWQTGGACGSWSVKDIIAHLASYEAVLVDILTAVTGGGTNAALQRYLELGGQFNDDEVGKRQAKTVQEVVAEFNDTHARAMALIETIPATTLRQNGTLPWYGAEYSLDDVLVYMYYGHQREHSAQIAGFRDRQNQR